MGRGLRKMCAGSVEEYVSVVGSNAFMDFVESIQAEGVVLERKPMGEGTKAKTPVHSKLHYVNADGDISNYYPDFLVKLSPTRMVIVETKGLEDLDVPLKMQRLRQWCEDINRIQAEVTYDFVYVDEESFEKYKPGSFKQLVNGFREYKEDR